MSDLMTTIEGNLPPPFEWCHIPEGNVTLEDASKGRKPVGTKGGTFHVPSFVIAKHPITNAQYLVFVDATDGYQNLEWWDYSEVAQRWRARYPETQPVGVEGENSPRTNVTWYEAIAFCRWLDMRITGVKHALPLHITLPTEHQWLRAFQASEINLTPLVWCLNQWGTGLSQLSTGRHRGISGRFGEHPGTRYARLGFRLITI